jgi:hypothetical protein
MPKLISYDINAKGEHSNEKVIDLVQDGKMKGAETVLGELKEEHEQLKRDHKEMEVLLSTIANLEEQMEECYSEDVVDDKIEEALDEAREEFDEEMYRVADEHEEEMRDLTEEKDAEIERLTKTLARCSGSNLPKWTLTRDAPHTFAEAMTMIMECETQNLKLTQQFELVEQSTESSAYLELEIEDLKKQVIMERRKCGHFAHMVAMLPDDMADKWWDDKMEDWRWEEDGKSESESEEEEE